MKYKKKKPYFELFKTKYKLIPTKDIFITDPVLTILMSYPYFIFTYYINPNYRIDFWWQVDESQVKSSSMLLSPTIEIYKGGWVFDKNQNKFYHSAILKKLIENLLKNENLHKINNKYVILKEFLLHKELNDFFSFKMRYPYSIYLIEGKFQLYVSFMFVENILNPNYFAYAIQERNTTLEVFLNYSYNYRDILLQVFTETLLRDVVDRYLFLKWKHTVANIIGKDLLEEYLRESDRYYFPIIKEKRTEVYHGKLS